MAKQACEPSRLEDPRLEVGEPRRRLWCLPRVYSHGTRLYDVHLRYEGVGGGVQPCGTFVW
jgi:hypothetical protein